jgi:phage recombination protein Bet
MSESSTELVRQGGERRGITQRARGDFDAGQMDLIRATVAKDCNPAELAMFLELCARYELDPFSKQIWAMKIRGAVQVVVSRDGLLSLANRHTPSEGFSGPGEFLGCESDVVREKDDFRKITDENGTRVIHSYSHKDRGAIVGAWAIVHRREHAPTYFFAEWSTYNSGQNVWKSHPEAMMVKSAESMALRKAFSITGVIGEAEAPRQVLTTSSEDESGGEIDWGENEELANSLREGFRLLGYRSAKIRALVNGTDEEQKQALLAKLNSELDALAEQEAEREGEGGDVVDAEVVG